MNKTTAATLSTIVLEDHDPSGRECALAGRKAAGHDTSTFCRPCYATILLEGLASSIVKPHAYQAGVAGSTRCRTCLAVAEHVAHQAHAFAPFGFEGALTYPQAIFGFPDRGALVMTTLDALTVCNSCDAATADPTSPAGYCADCDADAVRPDDCDHRPTDDGRRCRYCGIGAAPVSPAELAVALDLELVIIARRRQFASLS